jgi:radical SAM protein with 4Fe4S-binding SPASM domain
MTLFGGEPLLFTGCIDVIKHIKQKKMHCLLITNGSLIESLAENIVDSSLDELNVSLDGSKELHDQIRGMPGLFEKIMMGLKAVRYFKAVKKKQKPLINLQCTISKENYKHLEQMLDVAREAGADSLTYHNLIFINHDILEKQKSYDKLLNCSSDDWTGFIFEPGIEHEILQKKIIKILSGRYKFNVDFYPNFSPEELKLYYQDPCYTPHDYSCRCVSPWLVAYIFPDGQVKPCLNSSYSYGNIKDGPFSKIWNSKQAADFRRLLKENSIFPACVRCTELYRY